MVRRRNPAEQITSRLREAEVHLSTSISTAEVCKELAITENTVSRWRREFGALRLDQAKRLKLKRRIAD